MDAGQFRAHDVRVSTYIHGHAEPVLRSHRWRTAENSAGYLLARLTASDRLLDVGAGPGTISNDLAGRVAHVTATEVDAATCEITRGGITRPNVEVVEADVHRLPFADDSFDVVHAHQVLQHVADPVLALTEMARVCRPGGWVAARDADYAGFIWAPLDPVLDQWNAVYHEVARRNGGEPDAGRHLLGWAQRAGLEQIAATSSTWCFATPADREWWGGMWADRVVASTFAATALRLGLASRADLQAMADAWRRWACAPMGGCPFRTARCSSVSPTEKGPVAGAASPKPPTASLFGLSGERRGVRGALRSHPSDLL